MLDVCLKTSHASIAGLNSLSNNNKPAIDQKDLSLSHAVYIFHDFVNIQLTSPSSFVDFIHVLYKRNNFM